jgi:hypothetical protein
VKTHFGIFDDCGDYEHPLIICITTLCGYEGEIPTENSVNNWEEVTCKKCLRLKELYIEACKIDEEAIVRQMGEMADFIENQEATL